jgi:peptidoglycan/xylan/chitin deacetylase (PgdA/CDA1 family)
MALLLTAVPASGQVGAPLTPEPLAPVHRRMAITIDDLPVAAGVAGVEDQEAVTERLLAVLGANAVPAVGFVNESKLETMGAVDPRRVALLERWLDAGMELGNHGYAHLDLHEVAPDEWLADVLRGERVTRRLTTARGAPFRWFRHPFLHTGMSVEVQRRTSGFLAEHGYRIAPVTIDNGEYVYGGAYADASARGDSAAMDRIGRDYVRYMLEVVNYYAAQADAIAGDEAFPHVLLIHAYALNADWLGPLLDALRTGGWTWVDLEAALRHPAYQRSAEGWTGRGGITWLHRWTITEEMDRRVFAGEPHVPAWVVDLYEARQRRSGTTPVTPPQRRPSGRDALSRRGTGTRRSPRRSRPR